MSDAELNELERPFAVIDGICNQAENLDGRNKFHL